MRNGTSTRSIVPSPLLISRGHSLPLSFSSGTPTTAPKTISFSNARKIRWIFELDFMPTHPAKNEMTNAGSTERQQGNVAVAAPRQQINTKYLLSRSNNQQYNNMQRTNSFSGARGCLHERGSLNGTKTKPIRADD